MSFILDALKKAESERNRRVAPVLMDARIAPPRRGLPGWAWALGAVLLVNLLVLIWILVRQPAAPAIPAAASASPAASTSTATAATPVPEGVPAPAPVSAVAAPVTAPTPGLNALPAAPAAAASDPSLAAQDDEERLPSAQQLRAAGVPLPELQLNLHIYDAAPAYRSVLLNGQRLREGEFTPDGVKVERITPQAVILEASGRRFRLGTAD